MSYRAAILLLQDDKVALIERRRAGLHYLTFPGGHIEPGEEPEAAAIRETEEELGLQVAIRRLVVEGDFQGGSQYYFLVDAIGGTFGSGTGEEMLHPKPEKGTYRPVWMPVAQLLDQPIKPREMAELLVRFVKEGWPKETVVFQETSS
jgi:8-oxo-dGTP pyrophosphatase MutT (NUDIX family)